MKHAWLRGFRYEWERLIHDRRRLVLALLFIAFLISFPIICSFLFLGDGADGNFTPSIWNAETEARIEQEQAEALLYYKIAIGEAEWPPSWVKTETPLDAALYWYNYQACSFVLSIKTTDFFTGFSITSRLVSNDAGYRNYPYLASSRLFFYQDLSFMLIPILLSLAVHHALLEDRSAGFEKNYRSMGVDPRSLRRGKIVFASSESGAAILLFALVGLVFMRADKMSVYDGSHFFLTSVALVYFERWIILAIVLSPFFLFDLLIASLPKAEHYYLPVALAASLALLPSYSLLTVNMYNNMPQEEVIHYPFYNFLSSDGFRSIGILEVLGWPLLVDLGLAVILLLLRRPKRFPKGFAKEKSKVA